MGVRFREEGGGRVILKGADGSGSAFIASGARLREGVALLAINGVPVPDLVHAAQLLSSSARPITLEFEADAAAQRAESASVGGIRPPASRSLARPVGLSVRPADAAIAARIEIARGEDDEEGGAVGEEIPAADRGEELRVVDVRPA